jgi:hypothetical protein
VTFFKESFVIESRVGLGAKVLAKGAKVLTFQKRVFSTILDEKTPFQRF